MGCQQHVRQLAGRYQEFRDLGAEVLVLGPGRPAAAARLAEYLRVPFRILADPSGAGIDNLGLRRFLGFLRESGSIVLDREGVVRYAHTTINPGTALPLDDVLATLRVVQGSIS